MEIVLLIVVALLAAALALSVAALTRRRSAPADSRSLDILAQSLPDMGAVRAQVEAILQAQQSFRDGLAGLEAGLKGVETKVVESGSGVRESLQRDLRDARAMIEGMRVGQESRRQLEDELRQSTRRIEAVIAGSRSRGEAGENILAEALKNLPPDMVETDFRVGGKAVEFALKLADGKRVPIDSKWPRADVLEALDRADSPEKQAELVAQVEKAVELKVKEAAKYIDPASTIQWAVAAVPDAVFNLCRTSHFEAHKSRVVLMPYGLAVPYLLSLYNLHLQFCRSIQVEKLEGYLEQIERGIEKLSKETEGRISNAITQLGNARDECRTVLGKMKVASDSLRAMPGGPGEEGPAGP